MASHIRSLKNIRTLSARVDQFSLPYRSFMQISCLEMERARRGIERKSASARMAMIDARLVEIDQAKHELLQAVGVLDNGSAGHLPGLHLQPAPRRGVGGFKIRY